jgi:alkyldihydroxyacetonephosphate synthase
VTTPALARALAEAVGALHATRDGATYTVRPGAPPEVAAVLGIARGRKIPVAPVGTGSLGVAEGRAGAILLDTRRMTNILHIDELSLTVHAQAGIEIGALEAALGERGLTLGDFPLDTYRSTLGGALAARAPGRATSRFGPIESTCIGLSVVLADGRSVHVKAAPRRATGPDLMRLFLGSEGTLGIITAAVLRIQKQPEHRRFATHALPSIDAALGAARQALRLGARPSAMRIYDSEDAVMSGLTEIDPQGQALLLATFAGANELVLAEERVLERAVAERSGTALGAAPAEKWWRERGGPAATTAPLPEGARYQVAGPLARLGAIYRGVRASLLARGVACRGFIAHFHEDGGCVYFAFARGDAADEAAREAAIAAGGRPPAELGVDAGLASALRTLKQELDPHGILSGGRLL